MIDVLEGKALRASKPSPECTVVAFDGSVRSSKTITSLLMWARYVRKGPPGLLLMVGRTETAVINNLILPLQEMLGPNRVVINRGLGIVTMLGRTIAVIGANDEQATTKIQGMTLAGAYLDEAANVPESFFNMLRSRLSVPGAMLFLTCNPAGPKHWLLTKWLMRARYWIDAKGADHYNAEGLLWWRVTFVLPDNTWQMRNNPAFVAEIEASFTGMWFRRYILGEWVSSEGAVYEIWDSEQMTLQLAQLPAVEEVLISALDYGTTHRTRAYLLGLCRVQFDRFNRPVWRGGTGGVGLAKPVLVVLAEFAPETATVGQHARLYIDWLATHAHYGVPDWIAIDPAAAVFKAELFDRGITNVMNAHNAVVPGIQTVSSLLSTRRLFVVGDECPKLCDGIPSYMWDTKATERGETKPIKVDDDEADALRYAVYTSRRMWRALIPLAPISQDDAEDIAA